MSTPRFEVLWAEAAIRDLEQVVDYVGREAPMAAERLLDSVVERSKTLETMPLRGRVVPELERFEIASHRELIISPYRLVYRVDAGRVSVIGFFDGRRNLEDVLLARTLRL